jgi:hypothetical protein
MSEGSVKRVVVIMPFSTAGTRTAADLDAFFRDVIKLTIEDWGGFANRYRVTRSDADFDINPSIIRDLYEANIIIADLSGDVPNPNVMYELGVRLAVSNNPVVLIREKAGIRLPFDIGAYHTYEYSMSDLASLRSHLVEKIARFESGVESFRSPVLSALRTAPSVIKELQKERIGKTITSAVFGVRGGLRNVMGCVVAYLKELDVGLSPPNMVEALPGFILDNRGELERITWEKFAFTLNEPPGLSALITDLPLDDYIGRPAAKVWNSILTEFHTKFYASDFTWRVAPWATINNFIIEGTNLYNGLYALGDYIIVDDPERKKRAWSAQEEIISILSPRYVDEFKGPTN